jgi:predicted MFS family arabinose efflux permease
VLAGAFGGPATSLSFSIIADAIPPQVRGRAMGTVMGAFSVAAVFGVPLGLVLAEALGWRAPFFAVAGLGLVVGVSSIAALPPMRGHLDRLGPPGVGPALEGLRGLVRQPLVQLSYLMTSVVMMAGFLVIPNLASYLTLNLGFPQQHLKYAYGAGGVASFFATQLGGRLVDRFGSFRVGTAGAAMVMSVVFTLFYLPWTWAPTWVVVASFVAFMLSNGLRNVSYNTLTSKVPAPEVRARFQSLQSAVQNFSSGFAAWLSGQLLTAEPRAFEDPARAQRVLVGMDRVALVSLCLSLVIPPLLWLVERRVRARLAEAGPPTPAAIAA